MKITMYVGQGLWSTFPGIGQGSAQSTNFRVVSYDYGNPSNKNMTVPAKDFYWLFPDINTIRSKEFTEEMIGTHKLVVVIAELVYGAQTEFTLTIDVLAATNET